MSFLYWQRVKQVHQAQPATLPRVETFSPPQQYIFKPLPTLAKQNMHIRSKSRLLGTLFRQ